MANEPSLKHDSKAVPLDWCASEKYRMFLPAIVFQIGVVPPQVLICVVHFESGGSRLCLCVRHQTRAPPLHLPFQFAAPPESVCIQSVAPPESAYKPKWRMSDRVVRVYDTSQYEDQLS
ncbi:unnamed protein product [Phytophthora fragariaefolia]|uniref:Unnamed protein product n=1 Tax=Phytophthora fragariaefolia TaxID=1490495 RepID=A0A9W6YM20_9STRA|nr:unnamed protein product [Phytophthora fragariaefolia]